MKELCRLYLCRLHFLTTQIGHEPSLVAQAPLNECQETHAYPECQPHHPCGHVGSPNMLVAGCKRFFLSSGAGEGSLTNQRQKSRHVHRDVKTRSCDSSSFSSSSTPIMHLLQLGRELSGKTLRRFSIMILVHLLLERSRFDSAKVKLTPPMHETVTAPQEPRNTYEQGLNHTSKPATARPANKRKCLDPLQKRLLHGPTLDLYYHHFAAGFPHLLPCEQPQTPPCTTVAIH